MQRGQSLGLIEQSMMQSLFKMKDLATMNPNEIDSDALQNFNEIEIQKVIYLGCLGANKQFPYDFEQFIERFHYSFEETMKLYTKLISNITNGKTNNFAKGLRVVQSPQEKEIKPPKINIECVEDKYVLYVLIIGLIQKFLAFSHRIGGANSRREACL